MKRLSIALILCMVMFMNSVATVCYADTTSKHFVTNNSSISVIDEVISNSKVTTAGAAIDIYKGYVNEITNSQFKVNNAQYGGAIYNYGVSTLGEIKESLFEGNYAKSNGGAIYSVGKFSPISNTTFSNNAVSGDASKNAGYGGAIYAKLTSSKETLSIINSIFDNNKSSRNGGAIALFRGNLEIIDTAGKTAFTNNTVAGKNNDIYMGGSNQTITLTAYGEDASVTVGSGVDFNSGLNIKINGSTVASDYSTRGTGTGTIYFTGNIGSASKRAGIQLYGGTLSLINSNINTVYTGKMTVYNDTKLGFDINLDSENSSYDIFNFSSITGTGKLLFDSDSFNITGGFDDNSKSYTMALLSSSSSFKSRLQLMNGDTKVGVVYKYGDDGTPIYKIRITPDGKFIISVPLYIDPISNPLAYTMNFDDSDMNTVNFANATIEKNSKNYITLTLKKNITIDSWEDYPNSEGTLVERNIQIPRNVDIYGKNKTITALNNLKGMLISQTDENNPHMLYTNSTTFIDFKNAITNEGGTVYLYKTGFKNNVDNTTDGKGGALTNKSGIMYVNKDEKKAGSKALFYNNKAAFGGAIYNSGDLIVNYGIFGANAKKKTEFSNVATNGGAIYNLQSDTSSLLITNSTFIDNHAEENGGAIYNKYADTEVNDAVTVGGTFKRNMTLAETSSAGGFGGAIYNTGNMISEGSTFGQKSRAVEANAAINGGAVANLSGGKFTSQNSSYFSNIAKEKGGAIYNSGDGSKLTVKGGSFISNIANAGGAIYNDTGSILDLDSYEVTDNKGNTKKVVSTFTSNISKNGKGGAIYNLGAILPTLNSKGLPTSSAGNFVKNQTTFENEPVIIEKGETAEYTSPMGGAIYNEGSFDLASGLFTSNSASSQLVITIQKYPDGPYEKTETITTNVGKGGAVYSNSANDFYVTNSNFNKNTAAEAGGAVYNAKQQNQP